MHAYKTAVGLDVKEEQELKAEPAERSPVIHAVSWPQVDSLPIELLDFVSSLSKLLMCI